MSAAEILVVEDERLVAKAIQSELEHFGYHVSGIASTAREAVQVAADQRPDLVLMDIHLKGAADGIEAAQRIRARWGIPVVYLSAFSDAATLARASETDAFGYLLKPYEERELQTTIEMALAKHRAEQRLEETQRWLAAIHNGIDDAVIATDPENQIRIMNLATEALTGWRTEDALGLTLAKICHLVDDSGSIALDELAEKVANESRAAELPASTRLVAKNGRETPVEGTLAPIYDSHGDFLGTVLTMRNISARLEMDRVQRLSETRLRRTHKMEAVSRLAGGISHHLDNLLKAVLSNTSLALAGLPEETEGRELLERVEVAAQTAGGLVQRLSMFSMFSGRPAGELRQVDLGLLVPECLNEIQSLLNSQITLTYRPSAELWSVRSDELLLGQALLELALNSQNAMPHGGRLTIELCNLVLSASHLANHPDGRIGEFVRIRVRDNGRGILPEIRARLLEPFAISRDPAETGGLGMALVVAVVQQHHGWIECQSETGQGTQFDIYLPRYEAKVSKDYHLPA